MSRIRTVKPEFFKHEGLYDAERASGLPLRLAFAGLWTCCDREGRFEWRPRALKTDVLPYDDDVDFSAVMDALERFGFVVRYEVDGKPLGYVPGFTRHQIINNREAESKIPAPDASHIAPSDESPTREGNYNGEGKGREGEREGDTVANATGGDAAEEPDFRKAIFDRAVAYLGNHGTEQAKARQMVGKWLKDHSETEVFDAFSACARASPVDPIQWIIAHLTPKQTHRIRAQLPKDMQ